jgi:branched chain amino acid efflux pump
LPNAGAAFIVGNMRSFRRTMPSIRDPLTRDVSALAAAVLVIGVSFGAITVAAGLDAGRTVTMSLLVFAGGAQFLAVGVIGAGGSALTAVVAGLLLNSRLLPFGLAIADAVGGRGRGGRLLASRLVGSHLMTDESVAFALTQPDPARRRRAYWLAGAALYVAWNVGTLVGVLGGKAVGDPRVFGIDAAFPAGLLALLLPALRARPAMRVAVAAGALALATAPLLPPGLPVLVGLLGLVLALPVPSRRAAREGGASAAAQQANRESR